MPTLPSEAIRICACIGAGCIDINALTKRDAAGEGEHGVDVGGTQKSSDLPPDDDGYIRVVNHVHHRKVQAPP